MALQPCAALFVVSQANALSAVAMAAVAASAAAVDMWAAAALPDK